MDGMSGEYCASGFPPARTRFTAGSDETRISLPAFAGLSCEVDKYLPGYYVYQLAAGYKRTQRSSMHEAMEAVISKYREEVERRGADEKSERVPYTGPLETSTDYLALPQLVGGPRLQAARRTMAKGRAKRQDDEIPQHLLRLAASSGSYDVFGSLQDYLESWYQQPWLGVLFLDELRSEPCGPVLGKLLYTLGLAPLEEATMRTKSWTKRETTAEESTETEAEFTTELGSEDSTTFSDKYTDEWRKQMKFNLAPQLGAKYEGLEASVSESLDLEAGNTRTAEQQRNHTRETSRKATSRAKQNHKTSFTVTTERGFEDENTKVVRNPNPDRTMQLHYHRVLEKQRLRLERHDARLTLRLCLEDPARRVRDIVMKELEQLRPEIGADEGPEAPGTWEATLEITATAPGTWEPGNAWHEQPFSVTLPPGHSLTGLELKFIRAFNENGDEVYTDDAQGYRNDGGDFGYLPPVPTAGSTGTLNFNLLVVFAEPSLWINGTDVRTVELELFVHATPSAELTESTQQARAEWEAQELARRKERFSLGRLSAIVETDSLLKEVIWAEVLRRFFLDHYFWLGTEPPCDMLDELHSWFDFDLGVVEFLPWWMTPAGHRNQEALNDLLPYLDPVTIRALDGWPFLASPAAIVYLPIAPGHEREAIAQILGGPLAVLPAGQLNCVDDFVAFREERFAEPEVDPKPGESHPAPCVGTALGADDWDAEWDKPDDRYLVLDEWFETMPTDGVHVEAVLGVCDAASPRRAAELEANIRATVAAATLDEANAAAARAAIEDEPDGDEPDGDDQSENGDPPQGEGADG